MLLIVLFLLLLPQKNYAANDSCGLEVSFLSKNFQNILTWSTLNQKEFSYNVMYKIYGTDTWIEKVECTNITQNTCDLTNETSINGERYYGKVVINSKYCNISRITARFFPLIDTILDPPTVHLSRTSTSLAINITHVVEDLSKIYDGFLEYEIRISGKTPIISKDPYYEIEHLDLQTPYCVSAKLLYFKHSVSSNDTCVTEKTDDTSEEIINIMLCTVAVLVVIFIVLGTGYGIHKYVFVDNLKQPQILNLTSNNNKKLVFVDAHNITINIIKIEPNEQMMADKEEKTQVKTDLYFKRGGYDVNHNSGSTEDDDLGYVNLLEQVAATKPQVSGYDMPHNILMPTTAPSAIISTEEDLYGRIKCNTNIVPIQEKKTEEAHQKTEISEEKFAYLPKNDQPFTILNCELDEMEECSIVQDALNTNVTDGTDFSECDTLFIDWNPVSHELHIPNFTNKIEDEVVIEKCQEEEGLLSHLSHPIQIEGTSEELAYLEQRWELHVKMQE